MEKAYWLGRERASLNLARDAVGSEARLAHLDLAGRYSVKAAMAAAPGEDLADIPSPAIKPSETTASRVADNA